MTSVILSIDLEDPTDNYAVDGRWVNLTYRLLDFCDELQRKATFFAVGHVAEKKPDLIQAIVKRGHEIAYHTHDHVFLTQESPTRFRLESQTDKDRLEQITGCSVLGFRAPGFSLTNETLWALAILKDLGFRYSSSIMPTPLSRFGFPRAPHQPFLWPNNIIEFPLPVALGPLCVPYLGGVYLYALPLFLSAFWAAHTCPDECLWTYTHPFDFDVDEPFKQMPRTPFWMSWVMWKLRSRAPEKIRKILGFGPSTTFAKHIEDKGFPANLITFP